MAGSSPIHRKLHNDLLEQGGTCCPNRVARLTRLAGIKAQIGYKRRPGVYGGRPSVVVDNTLDWRFDVKAPDRAWVTDIIYIRTCEGFVYFAVVIDLYSRRVIGWAIQSRQTTDVVLQAPLMAVWRRKPKRRCWSTRIRDRSSQHGLGIVSETPQSGSLDEPSGELDNAVVESFFNLLKRERIRCKVYRSRDEARVRTCSTTSRCSTTRNANTSGMECCHRRVRATAETVTRGGVYETRGYSIRSKIIRL